MRIVGSYLLLGLLSECGIAHDFWIEPSTFTPSPGSPVKVGLRVGEHFQGEPYRRNNERIVRFVVRGPDGGERDIIGLDGADPAGLLRVEQPGLHVLAYQSNHAGLTLDGPKFEQYLRAEGLSEISRQRAARGETDRPAKEIYARYAKCLVRASDATGATSAGDLWAESLNLPLELVPRRDPTSLRPGDELPVAVFLRGKPLAGAAVFALSRAASRERQELRSDADGIVLVKLEHAGVWMIKLVHLERAAKDADWESFWGSLTFEVAGPAK